MKREEMIAAVIAKRERESLIEAVKAKRAGANEPSGVTQGLNTLLKASDAVSGSIRTAAFKGIEELTGIDIVDEERALKAATTLTGNEQFQTGAELLEKSGVPQLGQMSNIPGISELFSETGEGMALEKGGFFDITGRGALGAAVDVAADIPTLGMGRGLKAAAAGARGVQKLAKFPLEKLANLTAGSPSEILKSAGDALYRQSIAKFIALGARKGKKEVEAVYRKYGITGTRENMERKIFLMEQKLGATKGRVLNETDNAVARAKQQLAAFREAEENAIASGVEGAALPVKPIGLEQIEDSLDVGNVFNSLEQFMDRQKANLTREQKDKFINSLKKQLVDESDNDLAKLIKSKTKQLQDMTESAISKREAADQSIQRALGVPAPKEIPGITSETLALHDEIEELSRKLFHTTPTRLDSLKQFAQRKAFTPTGDPISGIDGKVWNEAGELLRKATEKVVRVTHNPDVAAKFKMVNAEYGTFANSKNAINAIKDISVLQAPSPFMTSLATVRPGMAATYYSVGALERLSKKSGGLGLRTSKAIEKAGDPLKLLSREGLRELLREFK